MSKDYFELYQKYKKKYLNLKKIYQRGSAPLDTLYSTTSIESIYNLEKYDFLHRPSSLTDDFSKLLSVYNKLDSVPFKNDYYYDFLPKYGTTRRVKYYTKEELKNHECQIYMEKEEIYIRSVYLSGKKFNEPTYFIYIMNPEGDIFISKKEKLSVMDENTRQIINFQINHTSLSYGNSVSAAGTFKISKKEDGFQLLTASNFSGHYKADLPETFNFLDKLHNSRINLDNLRYEFRSPIDLSIKIYQGKELYEDLKSKYQLKNLSSLDHQIYKIIDKISYSELNGDYIITGSTIYKEVPDVNADLDSIFIFQNRMLLEEFLKNNKLKLHEFFFGKEAEYDEFTEEEINLFIEKEIEIIRLSANINQQKATIKLFSYDKFNLNKSDFCRVFIKNKNKRLYKTRNLITNQINDILLFNNSYILNEDLNVNIIIDKNYIDNGITKLPGLITDMLLTGKLKYSLGNYWEKFSELLLKQYLEIYLFEIKKCDISQDLLTMSNLIIRSDRELSDKFKLHLNDKFKKLYSKYNKIYCNDIENFVLLYDYNLWEKPETFGEIISRNLSILKNRQIEILSNETLKQFLLEKGKISESDIININDFNSINSSNPNIKLVSKDSDDIYLCKFARRKGDSLSNSIFYESTSYQNLIKFYKRESLIEPFVDKNFNHVCYDFKKDLTELINLINRHEILSDEEKDEITKLELERHEDLTKGFLLSINNENSELEPIHELFFYRIQQLESSRWFNWNYENLFDRKVKINGVIYNNINISKIRDILDPKNLNNYIKIYGFTDNHGGNVLISENKKQFYNVDYEYCSISHPCQNLSKSIFNDIYGFNIFDFDVNIESYDDEYISFESNFEISNFKLKLLKMKIDGILSIVLRKFKELDSTYINGWEEILRASLFVCCAMTKQIDFEIEEGNRLKLNGDMSLNLFVLSYIFLNDAEDTNNSQVEPFYLNRLINNLRLQLE